MKKQTNNENEKTNKPTSLYICEGCGENTEA